MIGQKELDMKTPQVGQQTKDNKGSKDVGIEEQQTTPDQVDLGVGKASHMLLILFIVLCLSFVFWAHQSELDIFSMAQGEIVPSSKVKSVQHLEGGIVQRILVNEGQRVKKDEPLVELKATASDADVQELTVRIAALRMEIARLEAETTGGDNIIFPGDLEINQPNLVQQAKELFKARRERLEIEQERQRELINQRQRDIDEIRTRMLNQKDRIKLLEEQIEISEQLLEDQLTNRYEHLDLLQKHNSLKSSIEENEVAILQAEAALKAEQAQLTGILTNYKEEVQTDLDDAREQYNGYLERLRKYEDSFQRTVIRAPVDGIIKNLYVVTEGGVISPGETVLDIVPGDDLLVVEAKLPTQDIGYIHLGQKTVIKLNSADARRFGNLNGEVVQISPDTLITARGQPYYKVLISPEREYFESKGLRYQLYPGMIVMVSIHTGQRTVLEYLLSPFMNAMDNALTER